MVSTRDYSNFANNQVRLKTSISYNRIDRYLKIVRDNIVIFFMDTWTI